MGKNIWDFFKAVTGWLKGDGFDFKWTGLLEGFESTLKEMPNIAARTMTSVESELAAKLAAAQEKLGQKIGDKLAQGGAGAGAGAGGGAVGAAAAAASGGKRGGFGELVRSVSGGGPTVAERTLQEQKKSAKRQERQERLQEIMADKLTLMAQNILTVTSFS